MMRTIQGDGQPPFGGKGSVDKPPRRRFTLEKLLSGAGRS